MASIHVEGFSLGDLLELFRPGRGRPRRPPEPQQQPQRSGLTLESAPPFLMAQSCYQHVIRELTARKPEAGGLLLGPEGHPSVTHFVLDDTGKGTAASFTFDHERLNALLRQHLAVRLEGKGVVHSHPSGCTHLSEGDLVYAKKLLGNPKNDVSEVLMPLVVDGSLHPYVVFRDRPEEPAYARLVLF